MDLRHGDVEVVQQSIRMAKAPVTSGWTSWLLGITAPEPCTELLR
ncbi:hypothetical protein SHIRM173S_00935 [Streptomyces hirsutus]